jgi:hypothetical protein
MQRDEELDWFQCDRVRSSNFKASPLCFCLCVGGGIFKLNYPLTY